jgi:hypothetical protein
MKGCLYSFLTIAVWNHEIAPAHSFLNTGSNAGRLIPQSRPTRLVRYNFFQDMMMMIRLFLGIGVRR